MASSKHVVPRRPPSHDWPPEVTPADPDTPVEQRFLLHLRDHPDDLAMRMVYADWLEEREQPAKAEFLRLLAEPEIGPLERERMRVAAKVLDPEWRAIVSRVPIDKCEVRFELKCPRTWESLASADDPRVRRCDACARDVYFCATYDEIADCARRGECVAFCASLVRNRAMSTYDRHENEEILLGEIATVPFVRE